LDEFKDRIETFTVRLRQAMDMRGLKKAELRRSKAKNLRRRPNGRPKVDWLNTNKINDLPQIVYHILYGRYG